MLVYVVHPFHKLVVQIVLSASSIFFVALRTGAALWFPPWVWLRINVFPPVEIFHPRGPSTCVFA